MCRQEVAGDWGGRGPTPASLQGPVSTHTGSPPTASPTTLGSGQRGRSSDLTGFPCLARPRKKWVAGNLTGGWRTSKPLPGAMFALYQVYLFEGLVVSLAHTGDPNRCKLGPVPIYLLLSSPKRKGFALLFLFACFSSPKSDAILNRDKECLPLSPDLALGARDENRDVYI